MPKKKKSGLNKNLIGLISATNLLVLIAVQLLYEWVVDLSIAETIDTPYEQVGTQTVKILTSASISIFSLSTIIVVLYLVYKKQKKVRNPLLFALAPQLVIAAFYFVQQYELAFIDGLLSNLLFYLVTEFALILASVSVLVHEESTKKI